MQILFKGLVRLPENENSCIIYSHNLFVYMPYGDDLMLEGKIHIVRSQLHTLFYFYFYVILIFYKLYIMLTQFHCKLVLIYKNQTNTP